MNGRQLNSAIAQLDVTLDGGAVPNSYNSGHGGFATTVTVDAATARAVRGRGRSVSYGGSPMFRGCVIPPDPKAPAKAWPAATVAGKAYRPRKDAGRLFFDLA